MRFQGFIGPSYTLQSANYDCQRCINLYPEINEVGRGKEGEVASLVATPGLLLKATVGVGPIRGLYFSSDSALYAVSANKLYRLTSAFTATEIGTLNTSAGYVSMADNATTLVLVDGSFGYQHTLGSSSMSVIADLDFEAANQVTYQDGYFIFNKSGTGQFFWSDLNSVDFDALDVASAEGNPDEVTAVISDHRQLWLFGPYSAEVFYNSGNADQTFERIDGAFIEHGCAAHSPEAVQSPHDCTQRVRTLTTRFTCGPCHLRPTT